jgi:AraC family transcriptional regulator, positive regulator of tynA and feaB
VGAGRFDWEGTAMALLDGKALSPRDSLAVLSEVAARDINEVSVAAVGDGPISGGIQRETLGELSLIDVSGANIWARRTRAHVARSPLPFYLVSIQLTGITCFRWREQDIPVSRGDIFILDTLTPYDIHGERPFRQLVIKLPKSWLDGLTARPDLIAGARLRQDQPLARLLTGYLRNGFEAAPELSPSSAELFAKQSVELLAHALGEKHQNEHLPSQALRAALFARACRLIALRFAEPALAPDRIARSLGVSTRMLHKIFAEKYTTVMGRVWEERVSRAATLLTSQDAAHRSVTEIAFACGFNESAHFTRAFAARMRVTPTQWRKQAQLGELAG